MKKYERTQPATTVLIVVSVAALCLACGSVFLPPLLFSVLILIVVAWLFRSMTIEMSDTELIWRFGGGWFTKRVLLGEIASAKVVRTGLLEGWGIHYTRFGWLYNVSGFQAVAISLRNGKRFCLGSDEPEKLAVLLMERN